MKNLLCLFFLFTSQCFAPSSLSSLSFFSESGYNNTLSTSFPPTSTDHTHTANDMQHETGNPKNTTNPSKDEKKTDPKKKSTFMFGTVAILCFVTFVYFMQPNQTSDILEI